MVKKTRKTVEAPEVEVDEPEEVTIDEEEILVVASSARRRAVKENFVALLMQGTTYEYLGMKFRKGVPQPVPMKYLARFRSNGWFQVSGV